MKVAIDKDCINKIKDFREFDYVYIFDDEPFEELLKLKLHCIHKDYVDGVEVNLSNYDINAIKRATIDDDKWKKEPVKKEYKFAIIVPNYNNDHRRL